MEAATPQAFASLNQFYYSGSGPATTITLDLSVLATDGTDAPVSLDVIFSYDATQGAATNIAAIKAAVVAAAASVGISNMATSNVVIFMAVN